MSLNFGKSFLSTVWWNNQEALILQTYFVYEWLLSLIEMLILGNFNIEWILVWQFGQDSSNSSNFPNIQYIPQQKLWQFPNVFRFVHFMCTNQCTKLDKLLVCKLGNCLFATTAVSMCANYFAHKSFAVFLTTKPYRWGSFRKMKFAFSACTNQCTKFTTTVISYCAKLFVFIVIPTTKPWYYISLNNSLKRITAIFYLD